VDWHERLAELAVGFRVPGASLAFWHEGELTEVTAGVLNLDTGAQVIPDSLFQIGSITKVWTASQIMLLAEQGRLTLDTRIADLIPGFKVADPEITREATVRHLLTHTSGIDGDFFLDTGRGDDCVERYVEACADLGRSCPLGATLSYSNAGYVIAGRIVEILTGQIWDDALREQIIEPLGLTHVCTLPEDVLRFSAATGHIGGQDGGEITPTPVWGLPRSAGPAVLISARAADVVAFGRAHLDGGLLGKESSEAMREPQAAVPNPHLLGGHWGLGWILDCVDDRWIAQHAGNTFGQASMLWAVPDTGTVACLLMNGGHTDGMLKAVGRELLGELCGLRLPAPPEPPAVPPAVDPAVFAGRYVREGLVVTVTADARMRVEVTGDIAVKEEPFEVPLVPYSRSEAGTTFLCRRPGEPIWTPLVFYTLPDGSPYLHFSVRATPRVAAVPRAS
jgi:CubicO group peptidase (beta-lactamase class C family)